MSFLVVDTHAHLCSDDFAADREAVLAAAHAAGVTWVLDVADTLTTSQQAALWAAGREGVYATVGVHPHDAVSWNEQTAAQLQELLEQPQVLAVGETGLDYHYEFSSRDKQVEAFRAQLQLSLEYDKPVVIHNREADADVLAVLAEFKTKPVRGVFHCFWSDRLMADAVLAAGFYLGVGGAITFSSARDLRAVISQVPLERLLLETDAPYLAPTPYRGKRNEPAYVVRVAQALAELHQTSVEHVAEVTSANAAQLFLP
ncbi:MAG TPA: TatD family hydrolase [Firmicutes bacterium]|nr:TatD family hydrolase [Bacillota bacterium]